VKNKPSNKPVQAAVASLLGLLFNPENGGDIFLRIVRLSPKYMALQPRRRQPPFTDAAVRMTNPT
jgi:hypothetical protein